LSQEGPHTELAAFLDSHARPDGSFGPPAQPWGDATWTWRVLRCRELAGLPGSATKAEVIERFPRGDSWSRQAMKARLLARVDGKPGSPPPVPPFLPAMTWIGSPPLSELEALLEMHDIAGIKVDPRVLSQVLALWRGEDGGWRWPATLSETFTHVRHRTRFKSIPRPPVAPSTAGATAAAIHCYLYSGLGIKDAEAAATRLHGLRDPDGSYRQGNEDHEVSGLWATYDALRGLRGLAAAPRQPDHTARWVATHRHTSGGFAHSATEPASLEATWLALECLRLLERPLPAMPEEPLSGTWPDPGDPGDLKLFQALVQAGPDPGTSVAMAHAAGAHLLLIKDLRHEERARAARARAVAAGLSLDLRIACSREEHERAWGVEGLGYVTHCSDVVFSPSHTLGDRALHDSFSSIRRAWSPDRKRGALFFCASHGHRELLAPALEQSAAGVGYDALMAGWAFASGGDVVREHPWIERWTARLPVLGNHDAHADPFHWLHQGLRTRTLFFAGAPDVGSFMDAVRKGRVVAVAHNADGLSLWGHPHWVRRARRERSSWDHGRPDERRPVPAPTAIPIDASTRREMPAIGRGFGVVVRAAARLGDDALPSEVQVFVGPEEKPVPLQLAPARHDGAPVLWAPLPGLESGEHQVRVRAVGRETETRLRWRRPIPPTQAPVAWSIPHPPQHLDFNSVDELPFIRNTSVKPTDLAGALHVTCGRADFLISTAGKGAVHVTMTGGDAAGPLRFFVDGSPVEPEGGDVSSGAPRTLKLPLPDDDTSNRARRISLRTGLTGWVQRPSTSDLFLKRIAWEPKP